MKEFICAFSSDSRHLYRADIYKACSMPGGSIIHFRYKEKYVDDEILRNIRKYTNSTVVIFFTANNSLGNAPNNISIRKATLIKAEIVEQTGLFHAYLKLHDFCDIDIDTTADTSLKPPVKFFSHIKCKVNSEQEMWHKKIGIIKKHFPDTSFYNIKHIKDSFGTIKHPRIRRDKKSSYYRLNHGYKYFVDISLGNPDETDCKIRFKSSSDDITANIPNPIEITAQFDDITIPIYLKSLNVFSESSFVSFAPENMSKINSEFCLNIEIQKGIGLIRPILFGIYSILTILAVWVIKDNSDAIENIGKWDLPLNWDLIIWSLILTISLSLLFSHFNKK